MSAWIYQTKQTPLKAIRKKCIDCCAGNVLEVKLCPVTKCALYDYRLGHRPGWKPKSQTKSETEQDIEDFDDEEEYAEENDTLSERRRRKKI